MKAFRAILACFILLSLFCVWREYSHNELEFQNRSLLVANEQLVNLSKAQEEAITKKDDQIEKLEAEIDYLRYHFIEPPTTEEIVGYIDAMELQNLLREKLEFDEGARICISDVAGAKYTLVTKAAIERALKADDTDKLLRQDQHQWFDCDDMSLRLAGMLSTPGLEGQPGWSSVAFGEAWTHIPGSRYGHAFNLFITKESGELVIYRVEANCDSILGVETIPGKIWMIRF